MFSRRFWESSIIVRHRDRIRQDQGIWEVGEVCDHPSLSIWELRVFWELQLFWEFLVLELCVLTGFSCCLVRSSFQQFPPSHFETARISSRNLDQVLLRVV